MLAPPTDNYEQEPYNPEAPGITVSSRPQYRHFIPRIQTQRPNLIGLTSGDMDTQGSRGMAWAVIFSVVTLCLCASSPSCP